LFSQSGIPLKTNINPIGYINPYFLGNVKINDSLGIYKYFYAQSDKLGSINTTGIITNNFMNSNAIANFFNNGWRYYFAISSNSKLDTNIAIGKYKDSWNNYVLEINKDIKIRRKTDTKENQIKINEDSLCLFNKYYENRNQLFDRNTSFLLLRDTIKSYINNYKSFEINNNSISIGYNSNNSFNNIAIGVFANSKNSMQYNIAIGDYSLYSNQSNDNIAIGYYSMMLNTTGYSNTAIGTSSLRNNENGYGNTAIGYLSLINNVNGYGNTAIGYNAGYHNVKGSTNVYIGYSAGYYEDNNNTFYLHNGLGQYDKNSGITHSLLYGNFNADIDRQLLRINANTRIYGNLILQEKKAFYFGDENIDGTWRIIIVGNNLEFQRRELGVWVTKSTMMP